VFEGSISSALALYQKANVFLKSEEVDLWTCKALFNEGEFDRVIEILQKLIIKNPGNQILFYNLGITLQHKVISYF